MGWGRVGCCGGMRLKRGLESETCQPESWQLAGQEPARGTQAAGGSGRAP